MKCNNLKYIFVNIIYYIECLNILYMNNKLNYLLGCANSS